MFDVALSQGRATPCAHWQKPENAEDFLQARIPPVYSIPKRASATRSARGFVGRRCIGVLSALAVALTLAVFPAQADVDSAYLAYRQGDYAAAFKEFSEVAKQGNAFAQSYLGFMYERGQGVTADPSRS